MTRGSSDGNVNKVADSSHSHTSTNEFRNLSPNEIATLTIVAIVTLTCDKLCKHDNTIPRLARFAQHMHKHCRSSTIKYQVCCVDLSQKGNMVWSIPDHLGRRKEAIV